MRKKVRNGGTNTSLEDKRENRRDAENAENAEKNIAEDNRGADYGD